MCPSQETGLTALFLAAKKGYVKILEILFRLGADKEIKVGNRRLSIHDVAHVFKKKATLAELEKHKLVCEDISV